MTGQLTPFAFIPVAPSARWPRSVKSPRMSGVDPTAAEPEASLKVADGPAGDIAVYASITLFAFRLTQLFCQPAREAWLGFQHRLL